MANNLLLVISVFSIFLFIFTVLTYKKNTLKIKKEIIENKKALDACNSWCSNGEKLLKHLKDPSAHIDDLGIQMLILMEIHSWKKFLETHPYIKDNGYALSLESLLVDNFKEECDDYN